jgi:hypothetical protein
MKRVLLTAVLAMTVSAAWGQGKPAAKDPAKPASEATKPAEASKPAALPEKSSAVARKSKRGEDARHCLDKASNPDIIKCAEAYL